MATRRHRTNGTPPDLSLGRTETHKLSQRVLPVPNQLRRMTTTYHKLELRGAAPPHTPNRAISLSLRLSSPNPILQHPSPERPQLTTRCNSLNTLAATTYAPAPRPTFRNTPQPRRKTPFAPRQHFWPLSESYPPRPQHLAAFTPNAPTNSRQPVCYNIPRAQHA